jgi:hypothetical protein
MGDITTGQVAATLPPATTKWVGAAAPSQRSSNHDTDEAGTGAHPHTHMITTLRAKASLAEICSRPRLRAPGVSCYR